MDFEMNSYLSILLVLVDFARYILLELLAYLPYGISGGGYFVRSHGSPSTAPGGFKREGRGPIQWSDGKPLPSPAAKEPSIAAYFLISKIFSQYFNIC